MKVNEVMKRIHAMNVRSAWDKGSRLYALEMLSDLGNIELSRDTVKGILLNGAKDWKEYSYGANSLIFDGDIAKRLCTPSEFKRCNGGRWNPSRRENWLDVQARALNHAFNMILSVIR